jgi:hypothetical protein
VRLRGVNGEGSGQQILLLHMLQDGDLMMLLWQCPEWFCVAYVPGSRGAPKVIRVLLLHAIALRRFMAHVHVSTEVHEPRRQAQSTFLSVSLLRLEQATTPTAPSRIEVILLFSCTPDLSHSPKANSCNYFHVNREAISSLHSCVVRQPFRCHGPGR